jgi:hypothetical protein
VRRGSPALPPPEGERSGESTGKRWISWVVLKNAFPERGDNENSDVDMLIHRPTEVTRVGSFSIPSMDG